MEENQVTFASVYGNNEFPTSVTALIFQGLHKLKANFTHIYRDQGGSVNTGPGFLLKVSPSPTGCLYLWRERELAS